MNAKKIVVGVDGSPGSGAAIAWAIHEAGTSRAEIIAVHVVKPVVSHASAAASAGVRLHEFDHARPGRRSSVAHELFELLKTSGIEHRILTIEGHPATEILRVADDEDAGLVVVGNGLHSAMPEIFLGSVAHELTHRARRPLAIIPIHESDTAVDALGRKQREPTDTTLAAHDRLPTDRSPTRLRH
jgi:nucleotide-binding universal stress UspA family protein